MKKRHSELTMFSPTTQHWLSEIGVHTRSELVRLGSIHAYWLTQERGFDVTIHVVYKMEEVIFGVRRDELPQKLKAELQAAIKAGRPT